MEEVLRLTSRKHWMLCQRAIALRSSPEALFNRALALERLNLWVVARQAWNDYIANDPQSGWSNEARRHLRTAEQAVSARAEAKRVQDGAIRIFDEVLWRWAEAPDRAAADRALQQARDEERRLRGVRIGCARRRCLSDYRSRGGATWLTQAPSSGSPSVRVGPAGLPP